MLAYSPVHRDRRFYRKRPPLATAAEDLLDTHHVKIRRNLARFRGHEIKTTGDGILATFDGPARGVRCACAIADEFGRSGSKSCRTPYRRVRK